MVLLQAAVAHPAKFEDALQDAEGMLHPGSHPGLSRVLAAAFFIYIVLVPGWATSHVLSVWRRLMKRLCLSLITRIAPYLALLAMQLVGKHVHVGHIGCRGANRVHNAFLAINSDVRLGPEVLLVALLSSDTSPHRVLSLRSWWSWAEQ